MTLTSAQVVELRRLKKEAQPTFGKSRVRVQNNLERMGLAAYIRSGSHCVITDAGLAVLRQMDERASR